MADLFTVSMTGTPTHYTTTLGNGLFKFERWQGTITIYSPASFESCRRGIGEESLLIMLNDQFEAKPNPDIFHSTKAGRVWVYDRSSDWTLRIVGVGREEDSEGLLSSG